ncbi:MAG: hypothetical protein HKN94_11405 [Acidimicrobiales bacterium]|nr:hypothetical protein [Acidimicrobiales bacterium]RZV45434.1 MAG: hypothetical protein EX269_09885 [Acidimicrobiales bacterium]
MRRQLFLGQLSAMGLWLTVAALFYGRIFSGAAWLVPVLGGVLLSAAMALVFGRTSMPPSARAAALVVAGVLFVAIAVVLPTATVNSVGDFIDLLLGTTVDGWRNSLTPTLPIDTSIAEPLGFVGVVSWITGAITGTFVARSAQPAIPIIPGLLFVGLALPLAAPVGSAPYSLVAGLIASGLLLVLVRAVPEATLSDGSSSQVTEFVGERLLTERLISGVPVLLLVAAVVPVLVNLTPAPTEEPFDPRTLRVEEVQTTFSVNPLAQLKSQRTAEPAQRAFLLELPAPPDPAFFDRVGLVALDSFDGVNWNTGATYRDTPADLSSFREITVDELVVPQVIEVTGAQYPWIPAGNRPARIDADDVWFDEESGTLITPDGPTNLRYELLSRVAVPTEEQLRGAVVDRTDRSYLELPNLPNDSSLDRLGDRLVGSNDFDRLKALEQALKNDWTLVLTTSSAIPGTSVGRLERFMTAGEGYRDQFVASFAVAARNQAFPTRIVVGYRITEATDDNTEVYLDTITSAQYDAWPEVLFQGIGWVPFDPVPIASGEAGGNEEDATSVSEGQTVTQGPTPQEAEPEEDSEVADQEPRTTTTVRVLVVSGLFLVLFPLMLLFFVFAVKLLRRRWRRSIDEPTARVLAGWQESKDRLVEAGVDVRPDMTVKEIVSAGRRDLGVHASSPLSTLAPFVTAAIYAEEGPSDQIADLVWGEVELFDRHLNDSRSRIQTIRARVDPRPLLESV